MAGQSALASTWDKLLFLISFGVVFVAIWMGFGYQSIEDPEGTLDRMLERKRERDRHFEPPSTPEVVGLRQLEVALAAGEDATPPPQWTFYSYLGKLLKEGERVIIDRCRLQPLTLDLHDDPGWTGDGRIQLWWKPVRPPEVDRNQFMLRLLRLDAALDLSAEPEAIYHSDTGMTRAEQTPYEDDLATGEIQSGHSYLYQVEVKLNDGIMAEGDSPRVVRSPMVLGQAPLRWRLTRYDHRTTVVGSTRERSGVELTSADGLTHPGVRVSLIRHAAEVGHLLDVPRSYQEEVGSETYPFRMQDTPTGAGDSLLAWDLQTSFLGLLYPSRSYPDGQAGAPGDPGSGSGAGGDGGRDEDVTPDESTGNGEPPDQEPPSGTGEEPGPDDEKPKVDEEEDKPPSIDDPFK